MESLGLNGTELSEQCSLAAIHLFEDSDPPVLTRDRVSKILMNRHDAPAKSAARILTHEELAVLAKVLKVSIEWLLGQEQNPNPVVWNVLAEPDRVHAFAHLLEEYEEQGNHTKVWSQYPMPSYVSEAYVHAFNQVHYGRKSRLPNPRLLVDFYNRLARIRRERILQPNRPFDVTSLIYQSHFEHAVCGLGVFSAISRTILKRNLDVLIDTITNPSLRLKLVILKDHEGTDLDALRNAVSDYEMLAAVNTRFSVWNHHNGDIGWSEHHCYTESHRQLLDRMSAHALCRDVNETVELIKALRGRLRHSPK